MSKSENDFDRIAPAPVELTRDDSVAPTTGPGRSRSELMLWGTLATALLIAIAFVVFIPQFETDVVVEESPGGAPAPSQPGTRGSAAAPVETLSPFEQAQQQKQRKAAQDILEDLMEQESLLEDMSVKLWGQSDLDAALAVAKEGDSIFLTQDYEGAASRYREAQSRLDELVARGKRLLQDNLAKGFQALDDGDVTSSRSAFEMALAIDPDSSDAHKGLERAEKLNQVLALLAEARSLEAQERYTDALERYQKVMEVDPDTKGVKEAIDEARVAIRDQSFRKAMTAGYAALERKKYAQARQAFERARGISNNREARDALAEVELQVTSATIARHQREANAAMTEERWDDAVKAFQAALAVDSTLLFAVDGLANARRRAALDKDITAILDQPAALSADDAYEHAVEVYRRGVAVEDGGDRLAQQLDELEALLELYRVPVAVTFRSDNQTDVTVLKVARLGRFSSRELTLRPGFYTVVGARNGYRDVRRQIEVLAGEATPPITIRCDEKI